jgi:hypothetical protein
MSGGVRVSSVQTIEEQLRDLPKELSFYDPFLLHEVKEALEAGGEAYVSYGPDGAKNGLFIYDGYEATGTIFTKSREVFEYFYKLKPSSYIFSELEVVDHSRELWNIWQMDVDKAPLETKIRHQATIESDVGLLQRFIAIAQPETNPRWIRVALENGDKCFVVKIANRIVGIAWMSIVDGVARSHGLYVEPRFRRMGMTRDNLQARLIYLRSRHVHTLVNEIAESNVASASHAAKAGEKIVGKIFLYTTPESDEGASPAVGPVSMV